MHDIHNNVFTEIEINAKPEQVWSVLTDWDKLKDWSSSFIGISTPKLVKGELFISYFKNPLRAKPIELLHVCTEYEEGKIFGWSGNLIGQVMDHHIYSVHSTEKNTTIFKQEDGLHGRYSRLFNFLAERKMRALYEKFNKELKLRVEHLYPNE